MSTYRLIDTDAREAVVTGAASESEALAACPFLPADCVDGAVTWDDILEVARLHADGIPGVVHGYVVEEEAPNYGIGRVRLAMVGEGAALEEADGPWSGRRVLLVRYDRTGRASDQEQAMFEAAAGLACEIAARMGWALSDAAAADEGGADRLEEVSPRDSPHACSHRRPAIDDTRSDDFQRFCLDCGAAVLEGGAA